jgi:hypothetical protein
MKRIFARLLDYCKTHFYHPAKMGNQVMCTPRSRIPSGRLQQTGDEMIREYARMGVVEVDGKCIEKILATPIPSEPAQEARHPNRNPVARPHLTGVPTDYHFDTDDGFSATLSSACIAHPKQRFSTHCFIWIFSHHTPPTGMAQALLVIRHPPRCGLIKPKVDLPSGGQRAGAIRVRRRTQTSPACSGRLTRRLHRVTKQALPFI